MVVPRGEKKELSTDDSVTDPVVGIDPLQKALHTDFFGVDYSLRSCYRGQLFALKYMLNQFNML